MAKEGWTGNLLRCFKIHFILVIKISLNKAVNVAKGQCGYVVESVGLKELEFRI